MLTNPAFRAQSAIGTPPWEASGVLGAREMDAMLFWCTAVLYLFKDTMGFPAQVANIRWIQRLGPFLDRLEAIDRSFTAPRERTPAVGVHPRRTPRRRLRS